MRSEGPAAVVLAAGRGSRLGEWTRDRPKCLLEVAGRALLDRLLDGLAAAGVVDAIVVAGYAAGRVVDHLDGRCRVVTNPDWASAGSVVSLWHAREFVRDRPFVLVNGDVLLVPSLLCALTACPAPAATLVDTLKPRRDGEMNVILHDNRVMSIGRRVAASSSDGQSIQASRFDRAASGLLFDEIDCQLAAGRLDLAPSDCFGPVIERSRMVGVPVGDLAWDEIDTPDDLCRVRAQPAWCEMI